MNQQQQEEYLQFLVEECQDYIKEFQALQQSLGNSNEEDQSHQTNSKLKDQKARLEKEFSNTCLQIQKQRKQIQEYQREFERKRAQLQQFDREIHQKQAILEELNKQLKTPK